MNQTEEIVSRNKGKIDDLLNHIKQEIHLTSIIQLKMKDGIYKSFLHSKLEQLYDIDMELQQELIKYKKLKKEV